MQKDYRTILRWNLRSKVAQSCPSLWHPTVCSLPGSSVHGIFLARVLEWVAISFSRGSSRPRDRTRVSSIADRRFTVGATREAQNHILSIYCELGNLLNTTSTICSISWNNLIIPFWCMRKQRLRWIKLLTQAYIVIGDGARNENHVCLPCKPEFWTCVPQSKCPCRPVVLKVWSWDSGVGVTW